MCRYRISFGFDPRSILQNDRINADAAESDAAVEESVFFLPNFKMLLHEYVHCASHASCTCLYFSPLSLSCVLMCACCSCVSSPRYFHVGMQTYTSDVETLGTSVAEHSKDLIFTARCGRWVPVSS